MKVNENGIDTVAVQQLDNLDVFSFAPNLNLCTFAK